MKQQYEQGQAHGRTTVYDSAGHLAAELNFVKGLLQGEARYYTYGRLVRRAQYKDGKLDGVIEDLTSDGTVIQRTTYKDNVLHGPMIRYWTNGQVMERSSFDKGLSVGNAARFDQNGKPQGGEAPRMAERFEKLFRGS
jgi:antitoxin component YwqK of YwqJK toxin-antitoxin module